MTGQRKPLATWASLVEILIAILLLNLGFYLFVNHLDKPHFIYITMVGGWIGIGVAIELYIQLRKA